MIHQYTHQAGEIQVDMLEYADLDEAIAIYADMGELEDIVEYTREGGDEIHADLDEVIDIYADMPALEDIVEYQVVEMHEGMEVAFGLYGAVAAFEEVMECVDAQDAVLEQVDVGDDDEYDGEDPALYYNDHDGSCEVSRCGSCVRCYCEKCRPESCERRECMWYPGRTHFFCSCECAWNYPMACTIDCFYVNRERRQRKG